MDIRIVNTCNNDCLYCLEQDLRRKNPYISYDEIIQELEKEAKREILCFYGGNPILHPDIIKIIRAGKEMGYKNISFLSNGNGLDREMISNCKREGVSSISLYIHSLNSKIHHKINQSNFSLEQLLEVFGLILQEGINIRCIIHVNGLNVSELSKIVYVLYRKYNIHDFECINYKSVSRASNFQNILGYELLSYKKEVHKLQKIIEKNNLRIQFKGFDSF